MNRYYLALVLLCILNIFQNNSFAQLKNLEVKNSQWLNRHWQGKWITCPDIPQRDYAVLNFRKTFELKEKPSQFIIHVSADNRYRLYVNGKPILSGPARGTLHHWYFETVDIAPYLKAGDNIIAAAVWNMGVHAPIAQISAQTGLVIQGETKAEEVVNTNSSYKVIPNQAYTACSTDNMERLQAYIVIGPGDDFDAQKYPWGWELKTYDDSKWKSALVISDGIPEGAGTDNIWTLKPRNIPLIEESLLRLSHVEWIKGLELKNLNNFLKGTQAITIPAHSKVIILLDQSENTVAYPEINTSKGRNSSIKISYAEALFDQNRSKGNRDEVDGKTLIGNYDIYRPDGHDHRVFRPLWLRTYRYVQLEIETKEEPLVINDIYGYYATYPFEMKASFASNDTSMKDIWDVSWRTARLCAGETYFDCPYYEQLQYSGDTRIQALISLYVSGDDQLMRKSLLDFYYSLTPEGMIQGRYPSSRFQVIPTYSLWWISMIHDYWMHREDDVFTEQFLQGVSSVLHWFSQRIDKETKLVGKMDWWPFVDYTTGFSMGMPVGAKTGNSSILTLHYAYTLKQAAELFRHYGRVDQASKYLQEAESLNKTTFEQCFDATRTLMADDPTQKSFSQHASIMAILSGAIPNAKLEKEVMQQVVNDPTIIPVTLYYRFYLNRAMVQTGLANMYYSELKPWKDMLRIGLTTFAETPEPSRSDCHAWSASPSYDFLSVIAGIRPLAPGFKEVLVQPNFGELNDIDASMPHPAGMIVVKLQKNKRNELTGMVSLPSGVKGQFKWNNKIISLENGANSIQL